MEGSKGRSGHDSASEVDATRKKRIAALVDPEYAAVARYRNCGQRMRVGLAVVERARMERCFQRTYDAKRVPAEMMEMHLDRCLMSQSRTEGSAVVRWRRSGCTDSCTGDPFEKASAAWLARVLKLARKMKLRGHGTKYDGGIWTHASWQRMAARMCSDAVAKRKEVHRRIDSPVDGPNRRHQATKRVLENRLAQALQ